MSNFRIFQDQWEPWLSRLLVYLYAWADEGVKLTRKVLL